MDVGNYSTPQTAGYITDYHASSEFLGSSSHHDDPRARSKTGLDKSIQSIHKAETIVGTAQIFILIVEVSFFVEAFVVGIGSLLLLIHIAVMFYQCYQGKIDSSQIVIELAAIAFAALLGYLTRNLLHHSGPRLALDTTLIGLSTRKGFVELLTFLRLQINNSKPINHQSGAEEAKQIKLHHQHDSLEKAQAVLASVHILFLIFHVPMVWEAISIGCAVLFLMLHAYISYQQHQANLQLGVEVVFFAVMLFVAAVFFNKMLPYDDIRQALALLLMVLASHEAFVAFLESIKLWWRKQEEQRVYRSEGDKKWYVLR